MVGVLHRLSKKVSRAFKKDDNKGKTGPWTPPLEPPPLYDEYDASYPQPNSYTDPSGEDDRWQSPRRETWAPGFTSGIPAPRNHSAQNDTTAYRGSVFPVPEDSPVDLEYHRSQSDPQPRILGRPVPARIFRSSTWSHPHDEAQIANDAQIAAELQQEAWEEDYAETSTGQPRRQTRHYSNRYSASSDDFAPVNEAWQDYDAKLWDSTPPVFTPAPSSEPPSPPAPQSNLQAGPSTNNSWVGWIGSFQPFGAASDTPKYPARDGQPGNNPNFRSLQVESSTNRESQSSSQMGVPFRLKECIVCADEKSFARFPHQGPTSRCEHEPGTCLDCLKTYIETQMGNNAFNEQMIKCPECSQPFTVYDVQRYASPVIAELFMTRATDNTIDQIPNLFRCPAANCGSAQIHDSGDNSPIVRCVKCNGKFCFQHRVAWHETLSCAEYDRFLANPRGFRSAFELENERVEHERAIEERRRREQEESDAEYAQSLMASEQREEAKRKAEAEKRARREREDSERKRKEEEQRQQREQRRQMEEEASRKKQQEAANLATIAATTKKCPNRSCGWPIEKNAGCAHMTCRKCRHEFCWNCLRTYPGSCSGC